MQFELNKKKIHERTNFTRRSVRLIINSTNTNPNLEIIYFYLCVIIYCKENE